MFQRRKDKGSCANIKFGCANTNLDGKRFVALGKHGIHCRRPPKLKMQNGDDDTKKMQNAKWWWWYKDLEFICCISHIIVVNTTFSGWMYICFIIQHTCKSSFHVACNHCSPICFLDHICDTVIVVKHQTPGPVELQYGEAPPHHRDLCPSSSWDIQTSQSQ